MSLVANLPKAGGQGTRKLSATLLAITGGPTAVTTGLRSVDPGGAQACPQNSAATTPFQVATITAIVAGTVTVLVLDLAATPAIGVSARATNIGVLASGT